MSPFVARVAKGLPGSAKLYICPLGIKVDASDTRIYKSGTKNEPISIVWAGRVEKDQKRADLIDHQIGGGFVIFCAGGKVEKKQSGGFFFGQ